jgi:hypothetical protein
MQSIQTMQIFTVLIIGSMAAACTYDEGVGRTMLPPGPGHLQARWTQAIGGPDTETGDAVAIANNGDVIVAGRRSSPLQPSTTFVSRRAAATGAAVWDTTIAEPLASPRAAIGPGDHVVLCGSRSVEHAGLADMFVAELDPAGQVLWQRGMGAGSGAGASCLFGSDGRVLVAGRFTGTIDVGHGPVSSDLEGDAFLVAFTPGGAIAWGATFQGPGFQTLTSPLIRPDGDLAFVGQTTGPVSFGGNVIATSGALTMAVVTYSADGDHRWSSAGMTGAASRLALDAIGRFMLVGRTPDGDGIDRGFVRLLDGDDGTLLDTNPVELVNGNTRAVTIAPNGLILIAANVDPSDIEVVGIDETGTQLGGSTFHALGAPPFGRIHSLELQASAATSAGIAMTGNLAYGVDFGTGAVFAHGCIPSTDGTNASRSGADAFLVMFDWVED